MGSLHEIFFFLIVFQVAPTIIETRLLGSANIVDAAVVAIPDKENGEVGGQCDMITKTTKKIFFLGLSYIFFQKTHF